MKKLILLLYIFIFSNVSSQVTIDIFELECWKETIKKIDKASVVIAIQNSFDNWDEKDKARKPIVLFWRDSLFHWKFKVLIVDLKNKRWEESESSSVKLFFENYLNENSDKITTTFKEMFNDPKRTWQTTRYMKFYYRDSSEEIINSYYASSFGANGLFLDYPLVFNMYSYAINMSFNSKFKNKRKF